MPDMIGALRFFSFDTSLVILPPAVSRLRSCEQTPGSSERGGILLGRIYADWVEISDVTTPGPGDHAAPFGFVRSRNRAQRRIEDEWARSHGIVNYLGEWHTHTELNPSPSARDREMIQHVLVTSELATDCLFLLVQGIAGTLWVGRQTNGQLTALKRLWLH